MRFKVAGTLEGRPVVVEWIDGALVGDVETVRLVKRWARAGFEVSIAGVVGGRAELGDPRLAAATVLDVLDDRAKITGDPIPWPELPEGAIA